MSKSNKNTSKETSVYSIDEPLGEWISGLIARYKQMPKDDHYFRMRFKTAQYLFLVVGSVFLLVFLMLIGGMTLPKLRLDTRDMAIIVFFLYPSFLFSVCLYAYTLIDFVMYRLTGGHLIGNIIGWLIGILFLVLFAAHIGLLQKFVYLIF